MGKIIRLCLSAIGSTICAAFGGWDQGIICLCVFIGLDLATGLINALCFKNSDKTESGSYRSAEMRKGLMRKCGIFACIIVAVMLDNLLGVPYLRDITIIFFIINEGMSLIENLGLMGVPVPKAIIKTFAVLKDKYELEDNNENEGND